MVGDPALACLAKRATGSAHGRSVPALRLWSRVRVWLFRWPIKFSIAVIQFGISEWKHSASNGDTEREERLNQPRRKAPVQFNSGEERRSVAAARRTKRHFRREHPIARSGVAEKRGRRLVELRIKRKRHQRQGIENSRRRRIQFRTRSAEQCALHSLTRAAVRRTSWFGWRGRAFAGTMCAARVNSRAGHDGIFRADADRLTPCAKCH